MATPDAGAHAFFTADHRDCDEAWARLEEAAGGGGASAAWADFEQRLRRHFAMEEEVLFPALEASGPVGPVAVMRHEHAQMRAVLEEMGRRAAQGDFDGVLDQGDTLLMLVQQHNAKEEGVLYPLADRMLGGAWAPLAAQLQGYLH